MKEAIIIYLRMCVCAGDILFNKSHRLSIRLQFLFIQIFPPFDLFSFSDTRQSPHQSLFPQTPNYKCKCNFIIRTLFKNIIKTFLRDILQ